VTPDAADKSGPIFDTKPLQKDKIIMITIMCFPMTENILSNLNLLMPHKSLESSNNHFKEANNELSKTNQLIFKDLKKFQAELDMYHDVNYASKMEINCAKAKGDLISYKIKSQKSLNEHT
ncbi:hypothetical protein Tco_0030125, partial [Tanacetum coccineum]